MFDRPVITDHRQGRALRASELSLGEIAEALSGELRWTGDPGERSQVELRLEIELIARAKGQTTGAKE